MTFDNIMQIIRVIFFSAILIAIVILAIPFARKILVLSRTKKQKIIGTVFYVLFVILLMIICIAQLYSNWLW